MKIQRFLLAAAIATAATACSGDVTAPEPASRDPHVSPAATTDPAAPTVVDPGTGGDDGTGGLGSGCCVRP
jgi:ABC-type transport system substrate-binding protein